MKIDLIDRLINRPDIKTMKMVTISEAKSQLSALINSARNGEQILIMRGSKPAVTLNPVSENQLNLTPEIPLSALKEFEAEIAEDRKKGRLVKLGNTASQAAKRLRSTR